MQVCMIRQIQGGGAAKNSNLSDRSQCLEDELKKKTNSRNGDKMKSK